MKEGSRGIALFGAGLLVGVSILGAPAVARVVADFARDAGRVDGFNAVGPRAESRAGKIVATDKDGRLPDDIIDRAPDALRLADRRARAYQMRCSGPGGYASVPEDVGSDWIQVEGYGLTLQTGGVDPGARHCGATASRARRVATGVYEVATGLDFWCAIYPEAPAATVSVSGSDPLLASVEVGECDPSQGTVHLIRIFDPQGSPADGAFTLQLMRPHQILLP